MKRNLILTRLILFLVLLIGEAFASNLIPQPLPLNCSGGSALRFYNNGVMQGRNLGASAWGSVNDCDSLETFENIVMNNLNDFVVPPGSSNAVICRHSGMTEGIIQQLEVISQRCASLCAREGKIIGQLSALLYCQLSNALGGLSNPDLFIRRPVFVCGFNYQVSCDAKFVGDTQNNCSSYTRNPWIAVWNKTRHNQCAYDPALQPVEDEDLAN